jgi:NAD(P)H-hydrate epimerase
MKIFKSQSINELDKATCAAQKINSLDLMERAASAVTNEIVSRFYTNQRIVVIAGPGNNGGDALAVARMLTEQGFSAVEIYLFNVSQSKALSHDCDEELKRLRALDNVALTMVEREFVPPVLGPSDVVLDGLFGSGLRTPLQGGFVAVARYINESGAYVISIDVPSGLFGEWNDNTITRDMVHANLTLAFQQPRLSFFFAENAEVVGEVKVLDINLDHETILNTPSDFILVEEKNVSTTLRRRNPFSSKRDYGSVLLFAGSTGMYGAAILAARAALRGGAGLVTVHTGGYGMIALQTAVPCAMFEPDSQPSFISDMRPHHRHQAVAVGPGIGTNPLTIDALESLLKTSKAPLLLDADALNCIAARPALLQVLPQNTIITPHIGEFDRLFGEQRSCENRLRKAMEMAKYYNIIIVLKGHYTTVVRPTGKVYINSTGNPGMATAGSGDVLTGAIAAFLAQGYRPELAATMGVYFHGLAGDLAAAEMGIHGLTAEDIANFLGKAIQQVLNNKQN